MTPATRIYFDFLSNLFSYLLLCAIVKKDLNLTIPKHKHILLLGIWTLYSIPETIPFQSIIGTLCTLSNIFILCFPNLRRLPFLYIKYELMFNIGHFLIYGFYTLLTMDFNVALENAYYSRCKSTICTILLYLLYILYQNSKRMKQLHSPYKKIFTVIILSITMILGYLTLFICQTQELETPIIPVLFTALLILVAFCIQIYKHFMDLTEENMKSQILMEQSKMTADYSEQIEKNLKELHSLRHDIRNHLLIIDGYASQQRYDAVHNYIANITDSYTNTPLFDTSSNVASSILNAKYQLANHKNIDFSIVCDFPYIRIDDFSIITILGNLIDNAITATSKCESGYIRLSMQQMDSYLEIHIQNNHRETICKKHGEFVSTKPQDAYIHGLGIKNIHSTIEKLNGQMDISYDNETFEVHILLPNY